MLDCVSSYDAGLSVDGLLFEAPATFRMANSIYRLDGMLVDVLKDAALADQRREIIDDWLRHAGNQLTIYRKKRASKDRYGRWPSLLLISRHGVETDLDHSLQALLLQNGLGRVDLDGLSDFCATRLLAYERQARSAKKGLWSIEGYQIYDAIDDHLSALVSTYQLVQGKVISVFRSEKGTSYLNFGHHWKTDFTIALGKRALLQWEGDNKSLEDLRGSSIYVRGWIETQNGPLIRVMHPKQLSSDIGDTIE